MFAVIKTGGKQYLVSPGDKIKVEKLEDKPVQGGSASGGEVVFDQVLLLEKGKSLKIGAPLVEGAKVKGRILEQGRAKKVIAFKYKPKKRYQRKKNHRQHFTEVEIKEISLSTKKSAG